MSTAGNPDYPGAAANYAGSPQPMRAQQQSFNPPQPPPNYGTAAYAAQSQPIMMQAQPATMVVLSPTYMQLPPGPCVCTCPNCHQQITTRTVQRPGLLTWGLCAGLFLVGCWLGCCLIPFCIPEVQDVEHYCTNCGAMIGGRQSC